MAYAFETQLDLYKRKGDNTYAHVHYVDNSNKNNNMEKIIEISDDVDDNNP